MNVGCWLIFVVIFYESQLMSVNFLLKMFTIEAFHPLEINSFLLLLCFPFMCSHVVHL